MVLNLPLQYTEMLKLTQDVPLNIPWNLDICITLYTLIQTNFHSTLAINVSTFFSAVQYNLFFETKSLPAETMLNLHLFSKNAIAIVLLS